MFDVLKNLFGTLSSDDDARLSLGEEELRICSAALMVRAAMVDGDFAEEERVRLQQILQEKYGLSGPDALLLMAAAEEREHEAVDLYGFTSVLARHLDQEGRQKIVEMLWEIAFADGHLHEFESNVVWRVSELLGVSARDRIRLRKIVEARQQG